MSLPLPIAQRDARGKFSALEEPPFPLESQREPMPVLPILRDGHQSMAPTRASVWSTGTGGVTTGETRIRSPFCDAHTLFRRVPPGSTFQPGVHGPAINCNWRVVPAIARRSVPVQTTTSDAISRYVRMR